MDFIKNGVGRNGPKLSILDNTNDVFYMTKSQMFSTNTVN